MLLKSTLSILETFSQIVGPDAFFADSLIRDSLARTTLPQQGNRPLGGIYPSTREQVQQIVKKASALKIPLYPISGGKNWGYGDACAPMAGCLIVDFARMNRILEVNAELAYAVIEPGVTQGQLSAYLQEHHIPLMLDCTGAGPKASIVGNTLDRGFGHTPYGDHFSHSCDYEAVLADGTLITTGFGAYPNAQAQHVYKHGFGPSLDGLLTQSNFAIVTRMTVWLMPKPQESLYYFFSLNDPEEVGPLMDRLRPLYLAGTLRSVLHCVNDRRLLASSMQFPWDQANGKAPLDKQQPSLYKQLCQTFHVKPWTAGGMLTGSPEELAAAKKTIQRAFKGQAGLKLSFFSDKLIVRAAKWAARLPAWDFLNGIKRDLLKFGHLRELFHGTPTAVWLTPAHWRARQKPGSNLDPLKNDAGFIWMSPVLPMRSANVQEVIRLSEAVFDEFGFEFQLTFSCINPRALCAIMSLCFDKTNPEEAMRAEQCSKKLLDVLLTAGYVPYRGSPLVFERIQQQAPAYWEALSNLKQAWDGDSIVAPGRYLPHA